MRRPERSRWVKGKLRVRNALSTLVPSTLPFGSWQDTFLPLQFLSRTPGRPPNTARSLHGQLGGFSRCPVVNLLSPVVDPRTNYVMQRASSTFGDPTGGGNLDSRSRTPSWRLGSLLCAEASAACPML